MKQDFSKLPKIRDAEKESMLGTVFGVSGPGKNLLYTLHFNKQNVYM